MELRARIRPFARRAAITAALGVFLVPVAAGPATADAAKRKKKRYPVVTSVHPMDASIGDTIVIRGRNFNRGKNKNTVVFKRDGARALFVKETLGTSKQVRVELPESLRMFVAEGDSERFRLRVFSGRFGKRFTPTSKSPVITAPVIPDAPAPAAPGAAAAAPEPAKPGPAPVPVCHGDDDSDFLGAALENSLGLDACAADSDGDGVPDGYEYQSARDLNDDEYEDLNSYLPYPGKRPYPNPLHADAGTDYDGDGLPMEAEYRLFKAFGVPPAGLLPDDSFRLHYSDGEQYSLSTRLPDGSRFPSEDAATYPKEQEFRTWAAAHGYNPVLIAKSGPWYDHSNRQPFDLRDADHDGTVEPSEQSLADIDGDTWISDDERDEDADGLSNLDELRSRMTPGYWEKCYATSKEQPFPIAYEGTDLADADTDGDDVRDGADDQDHDDIPNVMELSRYDASGGFADWHATKGTCNPAEGLMNGPDTDGDGKQDPTVLHLETDYGRVNPFNPCLPYKWSRTCPVGITFGEEFAPFDGSPWYSLQ